MTRRPNRPTHRFRLCPADRQNIRNTNKLIEDKLSMKTQHYKILKIPHTN